MNSNSSSYRRNSRPCTCRDSSKWCGKISGNRGLMIPTLLAGMDISISISSSRFMSCHRSMLFMRCRIGGMLVRCLKVKLAAVMASGLDEWSC